MVFPGWPFAHHNLAMVGGADKLCSYLADGRHTVRVEVIASKALLPLSGYGLLTSTYSSLFYGADYDTTNVRNFHRSVWICPVALFVQGQYPKVHLSKERIKSPYASTRESHVILGLLMDAQKDKFPCQTINYFTLYPPAINIKLHGKCLAEIIRWIE